MDSSFFEAYKKTCLKPNELLVSILIPFTREVCNHCNILTSGYSTKGKMPSFKLVVESIFLRILAGYAVEG